MVEIVRKQHMDTVMFYEVHNSREAVIGGEITGVYLR